MERPWFPLHTRDWLDCKELARCDPTARCVLVYLMCLAHEGTPYGHLADDIGPLTPEYMASRCLVTVPALRRSITALEGARRLGRTPRGVLFVPRMVRDEEIRLKRATGGSLGGNPILRPKVPDKDNLPPNLTPPPSLEGEGWLDSHERTRSRSPGRTPADSGSVSESGSVVCPEENQHNPEKQSTPLELAIEQTASEIHRRHPAIRRCGISEVREKLRAIIRKFPTAEKIPKLNAINANHAAWCQTEKWTKDGGEYAKGLDNWLAPTKDRYDVPVPSDEEKLLNPLEKAGRLLDESNRLADTDFGLIPNPKYRGGVQ